MSPAVRPFNVDVVIVEPGGIKTPWGKIAVDHLRETSGAGAYAAAVAKAADGMAKLYGGKQLSNPSIIANTIAKAVTAPKPRTRYAAGYMARTVLFLRWLLSDRLFDRMIVSMAA